MAGRVRNDRITGATRQLSNLHIPKRHHANAPPSVPTGGSYNVGSSAFVSTPTGWSSSHASPGTGEATYMSHAVIDPVSQSGTITPVWSVPYEVGAKGPSGPAGPPGPTGANGAAGAAGTAGAAGATGAQEQDGLFRASRIPRHSRTTTEQPGYKAQPETPGQQGLKGTKGDTGAAGSAGSINNGSITEPKLDIDNTPSNYDALRFFTSSGMTWSSIIDLFLSLPAVADVAEGSFVGKRLGTGDAIDALYYKAESTNSELTIRMDDITNRGFFSNILVVGYSNEARAGIFNTGGSVHPKVPTGFKSFVEGILDGSNRTVELTWENGRPSFADTIYMDYGASSRVALIKDLNNGNRWESADLGGSLLFTKHQTYTISFWTASATGTVYNIDSLTEDYLAKVVDEKHLQESDGDIIGRINDVYAETAHGSYRGDFDETRAQGYGTGDMVTGKGSATGSTQTDANTVMYIASDNITKISGTDLAQPHEDDGNWLEISNGFEDVLHNEATATPSEITEKVWTLKGLNRAITANDNEREIVLEFEYTTSTAVNPSSTFTHVVMGPVDRWLSLAAKATTLKNFESTMCALMPGPFGASFGATVPVTMNTVCIARNSGNYDMLIYVANTLPSVKTYITLK